MDFISIIIQAIVQGLTEFLPVSSSGHLSVLQHFMSIDEGGLLISVFLHMGTLVAVFAVFRREIWNMIKEFFLTIRDIFIGKFSWSGMNDSRRMMFMIIISTAVLVPVYFIKDFFTGVEGDGDIIFEGCAFIYTAILLFLADACVKGYKTGKAVTVKDALIIGLFQCVALFPGVSRSGSTVSSALFCGLTRETAVTYSFILGIPAILGGCVTELKDAVDEGVTLDIPVLLTGFVVAAVVGLLAIKLINLIIKKDKLKIFGFYTAALGIFCIAVGIYENTSGTSFASLFGGSV